MLPNRPLLLKKADDIKPGKDAAVEYFTEQYSQLLIDNIDEYIEKF